MNSYHNVPQDTGSIIRSIILGVALFNQLLVSAGYSPLPFEDSQIEVMVSTVFTVVAAIVAWWKNNNLTRKARQADELAKQRGLK